ncbi:MAG: class I SAM-dependent methyltransferase, partial [Candidatus Limnocylindrales bacterium]
HGPYELGTRRAEPPGPLATESAPALLEQIRAEIAASGPLTFARFMAMALYDPDHGYYRVGADRPSRGGDFLTAPELHPIFGAAIARQVDDVWRRLGRPDPFVIREYGAGSGTLAVTVLDGLRGDDSGLVDVVRYEPVEINDVRRSEILERLGPVVRPATAAGGKPFTGVVLANEFLDALPVHRITQRDGRLLELFVDWDEAAGGLVERPGQLSTTALADRLEQDGVTLIDGQVGEICLDVEPWLAAVAGDLEQGLVLVIDFGHRAQALYDPVRRGGTLRAYSSQRAHGDPFIAVGRQDLTAHVDLTALEAAARADGLTVLGEVSQAELLLGCGLEELVDRARSNPGTSMEEWLRLRSAIARLLDPAALGAFRAVLLGRGLDPEPPLIGLSRQHVPD